MPKPHNRNRHKILFVINPVSGSIEKSGLREQIIMGVQGSDVDPAFFETQGGHDLAALKKVILTGKPATVVAAGGDGTANLAARAVLGTDVRLGFLPMGSANGIATELGIPSEPEDALEVVIRGHTIGMDILRINQKQYSIHLSDIGFNAHIIKRFEQQHRRGILTYARMFIAELLRMKTHHYIVHTQEGKNRIKAVMIVFANAGRYGTGAVINPRGRVDDGKFEMIVLKAYNLWQLARMVIPFMTGNIDRLRYVDYFTGTRFEVENPEYQDVHIDGEIVKPVPCITAEIVENALTVIVPAGKYPRHKD
ncbi:MAG TPA: diacylglycerol kinase family protein [Bacteroidales bacterium]|nr:diacylglycerol kinase family protein [Bacteroidales bacterium]